MPESLRAALFDVDGTLVDSNYLHTVSWWEAFTQAGHDVAMARIHRVIGMGSDRMLDAVLSADRRRDDDDGIRAAHTALYLTYRDRVRSLPGAPELLRACQKSGLQVVLASSAGAAEFASLRRALDAEDAITLAVCGDDAESSKPAPDLVEVALLKARVPAGEAVFVGDTLWDVEACQRAGVRSIGLLSGGICEAELRDAGQLPSTLTPPPCSPQQADSFPAPWASSGRCRPLNFRLV